MARFSARPLLFLFVTVILAFTAACRSNDRQEHAAASSQPNAPAIRPVVLPDLSGSDRAAQQQLGEAYRALTTKMANRSADPAALGAAYGEMGELLLAGEFTDAAEPCLLNAVALGSDPRWTYYLGHLYKRKGDLANAAEYFRRTVTTQPDNVAALWWLGNVYLDLGRPEDAEQQFSTALSKQPGALSAVYGLGRAALARNDYARAAEYLERVLMMNAQASAAHYPLGLAYRGLGRLDEAKAQLAQRTHMEILPRDPLMNELEGKLHSVTAYQDRGMRAAQSDNWTDAADQFRHAVELEPANVQARLDLSTALYRAGDPQAALNEAREAMRLDPQNRRAREMVTALSGSPR